MTGGPTIESQCMMVAYSHCMHPNTNDKPPSIEEIIIIIIGSIIFVYLLNKFVNFISK